MNSLSCKFYKAIGCDVENKIFQVYITSCNTFLLGSIYTSNNLNRCEIDQLSSDAYGIFLKKVCNDVQVETQLQPKKWVQISIGSSSGDEARPEIQAKGFCLDGKTAFHVRATNTNAVSARALCLLRFIEAMNRKRNENTTRDDSGVNRGVKEGQKPLLDQNSCLVGEFLKQSEK